MKGEFPTRRNVLKGTGVLVSASIAGCLNQSGGDGSGNDTTATSSASLSSTLSPVGEVSLSEVPESIFTIYPQYADMAVALGLGDTVNSVYVPEMSGTTMNHFYSQLDGVAFEWESLTNPLTEGVAKEQLLELDSDVHFVDPAWLSTQKGWSESDISELTETVGPFFGNFYSGTHATPPAEYGDDYQYYTLWELFEAVSQLVGRHDRFTALKTVYDGLISTIEDGLPPKAERPTAVRATLGDGNFFTYHLNKPGYWLADTRPLAAIDAFADTEWESGLWGTVGYEAMAEADPDVILHLWGMTPNYSTKETKATLASHPVGKNLQAVQNDRVYAQGMRYQGPIMNLFQLEMTAKQLYPDQFGAWPSYTDGEPYPTIPDGEQLFDRSAVAQIVTGEH